MEILSCLLVLIEIFDVLNFITRENLKFTIKLSTEINLLSRNFQH